MLEQNSRMMVFIYSRIIRFTALDIDAMKEILVPLLREEAPAP